MTTSIKTALKSDCRTNEHEHLLSVILKNAKLSKNRLLFEGLLKLLELDYRISSLEILFSVALGIIV